MIPMLDTHVETMRCMIYVDDRAKLEEF